jgi:hypothetical protein
MSAVEMQMCNVIWGDLLGDPNSLRHIELEGPQGGLISKFSVGAHQVLVLVDQTMADIGKS